MPSKKQRANKKLQVNANQGGNSRGQNFGAYLGGGYHGADQKRDVWTVAGYPAIVTFDALWNMQARFGIAKAGIHLIVNKCWESNPTITDGEFDGERTLTQFEQDLEVLINKHHLFARLKGVDWRNRIGRYAGILPIVTETEKTSPSDPASKSRGIESLLKLVPLPESQLSVENVQSNSDISSADYGMPTHYMLKQDVSGDRNPIENSEVRLDPSRVFIFAEGADDGSIFGIPANEAGFNDLLDMTKTLVAGSEGNYKNSKQRLVHNITDSNVAGVMATDKKLKAEWEKSNEEFSSGFDTSLMTYGITTQALQSMISDPTPAFTNSLNSFAASHGLPATEFIGAQMNKQATASNNSALNNAAESRRENTLNPSVTGFLMYLVDRGIMANPTNEILIEWDDLNEPTFGEKVTNMKLLAETAKVLTEAGRDPTFVINAEAHITKTLNIEDVATPSDLESFGEGDDLDKVIPDEEP